MDNQYMDNQNDTIPISEATPLDIPEEEIRSHIQAMNEAEREKLFANMKAAEAEKEKKEKSKPGKPFLLRDAIHNLFKTHSRNDLERFTSSDFVEAQKTVEKANQIDAQTKMQRKPHKKGKDASGKSLNEAEAATTVSDSHDIAPPDTTAFEDNEKMSAPKNAQVAQALASCSEDYAIFVYGITPPDIDNDLQMKCLQAGIDVLGVSIYPVGSGMYAGIINDCWNNRNALERMKQELLDELKRKTKLDFTVITLGAVKKRDLSPAMYLQRSLARLTAKATGRSERTDTADANLQELVTHLRKEIEANAIEQARRQFEQQMEENGELIPDEPVVIREAANMSPAEYDSFLSEEEQRMKREAKSRYIDDDVSIAQVLHNIEKHRTLDDPLYLIAIASVDMNTLIILEDTEDFEALCREADVSMIQCSYIYAISRSGGHWYGNNHATKEIENIFDGLSEIIVTNGGRFRKEYLYYVPNISIFKDIFLQ